jgi:sterol desaturase/sphingolipid hydroxylase (fatty acid hydroxylase superfamily)
MKNKLSGLVTYFTYPLLLVATLVTIYLVDSRHWDLKRAMLIYSLSLVFVLISLERAFPIAQKWGMSFASFLRDIKYLFTSALTIGLVRWGFGVLAILLSEHHRGPLAEVHLGISVVLFLLVFEFIQYWFHRLSHEGSGQIGAFLWRSHAAHHMPDQVYVVMHGVFHPVNALISALLLQVTFLLLGLSPQAVFAAMLIIDLQAMVSHFNVDIRAGLFNYVFSGTELHRYHHSSKISEARNYGVVLTLWDLVFGTFKYQPGKLPASLGLDSTGEYPHSRNFWRVLALPFQPGRMEHFPPVLETKAAN